MADSQQAFAAAVSRHGSVQAAVAAAEGIAAKLLAAEQGTSRVWAESFIARSRMLPHMGDCPHARPWMRAPVTCDACVYDELMAKAWAQDIPDAETRRKRAVLATARLMVSYWSDSRDEPTEADVKLVQRMLDTFAAEN